jgi:hypothetical protein
LLISVNESRSLGTTRAAATIWRTFNSKKKRKKSERVNEVERRHARKGPGMSGRTGKNNMYVRKKKPTARRAQGPGRRAVQQSGSSKGILGRQT